MSKNMRFIQLLDQKYEQAKAAVNNFYDDGIFANFTPSSAGQPLAPLLAQIKPPPEPESMTQEQLMATCQNIRANVKRGRPGNVEIQLNKGRQKSDNQLFPLGNTVIKALPMDSLQPVYLFIKAGDTLEASVFLGGDSVAGILLMQDENGDDCFLRLSEFHLLSLRENPDPRKEVGLMTSYLWLTADVYSSVIYAFNLNPIKNLLLSDFLQMEWQKAKDAASMSSGTDGGENHG